MTPSLPAVTWPADLPQTDLELVLVLLHNKTDGSLRVWLIHGVPATDAPTPSWLPIRAWTKGIGNQHQMFFWRRVVTPEQLLTLLDGATREGVLMTDAQRLPVTLVERAPVLLPASDSTTALPPVMDESAWLWEWWDIGKDVAQTLSPGRRVRVNAQVRARLGVDLDHWQDRVGNLLLFFPCDFRTRWHYDPAARTLVVKTTLSPGDAASYEVEVRGWEDGDLAVARRADLTRPALLFRDIPACDRFDVWVWQGGRLVHRQEGHVILRAISFDMHVHVGSRGRNQYTHRAASSLVGEDEPEPWKRLQRERRVDRRRADLAREPALKFYAPDGGDAQRQEAVHDLEQVLNRARRSIRIWDPYFGTNAADTSRRGTPEDDLHFLEAVRNLDVHLRVLSSADDWTASNGSASLAALGARLQAARRAAPRVYGRVTWRAWVRADETTFHDRFIVVDDSDVWLLGSSINGLGKKHTTLLKLEYPQEIVVAFDRIWDGQTHGVGRVLPVFDGTSGVRRGT